MPSRSLTPHPARLHRLLRPHRPRLPYDSDVVWHKRSHTTSIVNLFFTTPMCHWSIQRSADCLPTFANHFLSCYNASPAPQISGTTKRRIPGLRIPKKRMEIGLGRSGEVVLQPFIREWGLACRPGEPRGRGLRERFKRSTKYHHDRRPRISRIGSL